MPAWQMDQLLTLRNYCFEGHTKRSQPSTSYASSTKLKQAASQRQHSYSVHGTT